MNKKLLMIISLMLCLSVFLCACATGNGDETTGTTEPSGTAQPTTDPTTEPTTEPTDDGKVTYTVIVKDSQGNPVVGEYVQICKENATCFIPVATDENGAATWRLEEAADYYGSVTSDADAKAYFENKFEVTIVWDKAAAE